MTVSLTQVAALYDDSGKPSPLMKTCASHFKDRFREILKKLQAPSNAKTKAGSSTDANGSVMTLEASFPVDAGEDAVKQATALAARLFTPTMKGAGFTFEGVQSPAKLFPLKSAGAVCMEVTEAAGQISLKAGMAVLHPDSKPVLKEEAKAPLQNSPPKSKEMSPPKVEGPLILWSQRQVKWTSGMPAGVEKVSLDTANPHWYLYVETPYGKEYGSSSGKSFQMNVPAELVKKIKAKYPEGIPEGILFDLTAKPALKAVKPFLASLSKAVTVTGFYELLFTTLKQKPQTYVCAWLPSAPYKLERQVYRDTQIWQVQVATAVATSVGFKPQAKVGGFFEAVVKEREGLWYKIPTSSSGTIDRTTTDPKSLFTNNENIRVDGYAASYVLNPAGQPILDRAPDYAKILLKVPAFKKGTIDSDELAEKCVELYAAHHQQVKKDKEKADKQLAQKTKGLTADEVDAKLRDSGFFDTYNWDYDQTNESWSLAPKFGRDRGGYWDDYREEYRSEFLEGWFKDLGKFMKDNFGNKVSWGEGEKGWIEVSFG